MALICDDEIEALDGNGRIVGDQPLRIRRRILEGGRLLILFGNLLARQNGKTRWIFETTT